MSFFRNLFRAAPVAAPIAATVTNTSVICGADKTLKKLKEEQNDRLLKHSPYQFITVEQEALSNDPDIAKRQERDGRWKATASADASKYILRPLTIHATTEEEAKKKIKSMVIFMHRSPNFPILKNTNNYTRVDVISRTDKGDNSFVMTRNIVDAIMNIPGMESDIIADPIDGIRQVTWTTANLRKYEIALYAYRDTNNMQETQHVTSMRAFMAQLEQMGRGTVTCTIA